MPSNIVDINKVGLLLQSDLRITFKRDLLLLIGLFVFSFIYFLMTVGDFDRFHDGFVRLPDYLIKTTTFHFAYFPGFLLFGGFLYTSLTFWELGKKTTRQFFLGLPASTLDKLLSRWISTAILFPVACLLVYQVFAQFTYGWMNTKGFEMVRLSLFDSWVFYWMGVYILIQSIFLLGAIVMPRFSLIKSMLVFTALLLLCRLAYVISVDGLMPLFSERASELAVNGSWKLNKSIFLYGAEVYELLGNLPALFLKLFGFGLFPVLLFVSYLKLKEKEI